MPVNVFFYLYTGAAIAAFYLIRISTVPRVSSEVTVLYALRSIDHLYVDRALAKIGLGILIKISARVRKGGIEIPKVK